MQADVKRAIQRMKHNAAAFGVNPDRVVLGGDSAGAHLALLAASAPQDPLLTPDDPRGENLSVRGVINCYALADYRLESKTPVTRGPIQEATRRLLIHLMERWSGATIPPEDEWNAQFTGGQREAWPDLYRRISPITHVGPDSPPTLQFVGAHDVYASRGGSTLAYTGSCRPPACRPSTWNFHRPTMPSTCSSRRYRQQRSRRCTRSTASWR